jgi:aubergine-like protein
VSNFPHLKLEVWPGYVTRVEEKEGGLMLTCDVSHRVLRAETAYDVLQDIRRSRDPSQSFVVRANKSLLGQVVLTK